MSSLFRFTRVLRFCAVAVFALISWRRYISVWFFLQPVWCLYMNIAEMLRVIKGVTEQDFDMTTEAVDFSINLRSATTPSNAAHVLSEDESGPATLQFVTVRFCNLLKQDDKGNEA
jgi:hypothetical protein